MAKVFNPGVRVAQIQICRRTRTGFDAAGADLYEYSAYATRYAAFEALSGNKLIAAQQVWPNARYQFKFDRVPGLDTTMRISWWTGETTLWLEILDAPVPSSYPPEQIVTCAVIPVMP